MKLLAGQLNNELKVTVKLCGADTLSLNTDHSLCSFYFKGIVVHFVKYTYLLFANRLDEKIDTTLSVCQCH